MQFNGSLKFLFRGKKQANIGLSKIKQFFHTADTSNIYQTIRYQTRYLSTITTAPSNDDLTDSASLYVHWPYCAKRCTYCDFNKYVKSNVNNQRMTNCLVREATTLLELSGVKEITSIFFGGGTPSLAPPDTMYQIIEALSQQIHLPNQTEITLEANPTALEVRKLQDFRVAGINRLSIGIQSLNDAYLRLLGRNHSASESILCVQEAVNLFKGRVSIDLIFGIPGQTLKSWLGELNEALNFCDDHLSLYQLTVKRGTPLFMQVAKGVLTLPKDDVMADMYEASVEVLEKAHFSRYEVSNFARNGAESCHNRSYWQGKQYIGIGPGAHGRFVPKNSNKRLEDGEKICREARVQTLEPEQWMNEVELVGHATRRAIPLSLKDLLEEALVMGLRTAEGIDYFVWYQRTGLDLKQILMNSETFRDYMEQNFLVFHGTQLKATPKGILVLDSILPGLLLVLQDYFKPILKHFENQNK